MSQTTLSYTEPSDVVEAFSDLILFTDSQGRIVTGNQKARKRLNSTLSGYYFWEALLLPEKNLEQVLQKFPPESVSEVSTGEDKSYSLRIIPIPSQVSSQEGFIIICTDNTPLVQMHEEKEAEVEEMNIALRNVIRTAQEEQQEVKHDLAQQFREQILPVVDRLVREPSPEIRRNYRNLIKDHFWEVAGDSLNQLKFKLTPRESEVCRLIQMGRSSKQISELLKMSFETVQTHRKNIRKKLNLKGNKISLFSYLQNQDSLNLTEE